MIAIKVGMSAFKKICVICFIELPLKMMKNPFYFILKALFFKNYAKNEAGRLVPDLLLFFKKALDEVKENCLQLSFNMFQQPSIWHTIKINCIKPQPIDHQTIRDMLNLNFSEKSLELVSASHFANNCSIKMIFMLHSIN